MARLLDDLLDVARITRGRIVLRNERLDLRDTARSAIEALGPFLAEHEYAPRRSRSTTSRSRSSAIRRGSSRSRRTCSATRRSTRRAAGTSASRCSATADHALIRVTDNGRGIEPRDAAADLRPVRAGATVARALGGGLGIGLTLLRSLVDLHNGRVEAHSDGPGQRQHLHRLAAAARPPSTDAGDAAAASPRPRSGRSCSSRIRPTRAA